MSTYIKLFRQTIDHDLLAHDNNAFVVFTKILLRVDWETGTMITGRHKLASLTNLNPNTLYSTIQRLVNNNMITTSTTRHNTKITVVNWQKFQGDNNLDNRRTTREQQENNTNNKNKEVINTIPTEDALLVLDYYNQVFGQKLKPIQARLGKVKTRLKSYTLDEIKLAIDNAHNDNFFTGGSSGGWTGNLDNIIRNDMNLEKYLTLNNNTKKESIY